LEERIQKKVKQLKNGPTPFLVCLLVFAHFWKTEKKSSVILARVRAGSAFESQRSVRVLLDGQAMRAK